MNIDLNLNKTNCIYNKYSPQQNTASQNQSAPSFGSTKKLTKEQADAIAAQHIASQNLQNKIPLIQEKDVNIAVTIRGLDNVKHNTREVFDYRCNGMFYKDDFWDNFNKPILMKNKNCDEKRFGETTALVIPLNLKSEGIRVNDNAVIMLNGDIPAKLMSGLVSYLIEVGVLKEDKAKQRIEINSLDPKRFMSQPQIKKIIANFFKQKRLEYPTNNSQAQPTTQQNVHKPTKISSNDVNIVSVGYELHPQNTRAIKDYRSEFLANNRRFTVLHEKIANNGQQKDTTIMLIPSKKDPWDCITIAIDKNIDENECKKLINHLAKNKIFNITDDSFKRAIIEHFNA